MLHPRERKRANNVVIRATLSGEMTNAQLLSAFARAMAGKLSQHTIDQYVSCIADICAYLERQDGSDLHVSLWSKEHIWEYIHFAEANYCRSFNSHRLNDTPGASCRKRIWIGSKPPAEAVKLCAGCGSFESSRHSIARRVDAIHKFFRFLTRSGVVPFNFLRDVSTEYYEDNINGPRRERRRNPSVDEMLKLVNGTMNARNRAFYAASAKWGFRLNEMLVLDRYTSFPDFDDGGDLVILPETKGRLDKRKGNRVSVIDAELRPIIAQYFDWWDRNVKRQDDGKPITTRLWISERGSAITVSWTFYDHLFYPDCLRLGLMQPGDDLDQMKRWTSHCQRHFMEKVLMMNNCPDTWSKHLRGDIVKDARGHYFVPTPEQIREKYLEWMPKLGFLPVAQPDPANLPRIARRDDLGIHIAILQEGHARAKAWASKNGLVISSRVVELDEHGAELRNVAFVPKRRAPTFLIAYQRLNPGVRLALRADAEAPVHGRAVKKHVQLKQFEEALAALGGEP